MDSFRKSSYNRRYDNANENKYQPSSLSNVYEDLMSSNKESPIISPYEMKKSPNYNNFPNNYHFINRNQIRSLSPPYIQNNQYENNISSNVYKNFLSNYDQDKNNNNFSYKNENYRNKSFDSRNNINRSTNNIFSYNKNNDNNFNSINKRNFYDTVTNFSKGNNNRINNNLYNNKEEYKKTNNFNSFNISTYRPNSFENYSNYNRNNNYNSNRSNQSFYSKSPNSSNLRNYDKKNNILSNNYYNNYGQIKNQELNISPNKLYRGFSHDNVHRRNDYNSNKKKYKIASYSSSTMAGTNGYGITKTNQDSYLIKIDKNDNNENEYTFGVFDGHGLEGHLVSQSIKQFFMNCSYFDFNTNSMIFSIFSSLSQLINNSQYFDSIESGSTVVLIHINPEKIISINCGDSRAILIKKNKSIVLLSRDHKPEIPEEKERIEKSGGRVDKIFGMGPYRVWFKNENFPGLAMSRSIGDQLAHKAGVSDIPEIKEFDIYDMDPLAVIVASDGIWEFMSNEEVRNIVMNYVYSKDANNCAKKLVEKARLVWQGTGYAIDDITCVVAFFND